MGERRGEERAGRGGDGFQGLCIVRCYSFDPSVAPIGAVRCGRRAAVDGETA